MWVLGPNGDLINLNMAQRIYIANGVVWADMVGNIDPRCICIFAGAGNSPDKECEHFINGIKGRLAVGTYHAVR